MGKLNKNQKGFGPVELIILFVVIVLVGGGGFIVYRLSSGSDLSKSSCFKSLCLKYPVDWTARTYTPGQDSDELALYGLTITGTVEQVSIQYSPYVDNPLSPCPTSSSSNCLIFTTTTIKSMPHWQNASLVGGVMQRDGSDTPILFVASDDTLSNYNLKAGQTVSEKDPLYFGTITHSPASDTYRASLIAEDSSGTSYKNLNAAKDWLNNSGAQTAEKILLSATVAP